MLLGGMTLDIMNSRCVITAVFHLAASNMPQLRHHQSENICMRKAASVIESALSVSRSWELPFLLYRCKLENVAVSFVFESLVCNSLNLSRISSLKRSLKIVDQGQYLSVRLVNNIEDCTIKNWEAKRIFHYSTIVKGILQFTAYLYDRKGKGYAARGVNYDRKMYIIQANVTVI